jgi:hypothetical protein
VGHTLPEFLETDDPDVLEGALHALPTLPVRTAPVIIYCPTDRRGLLVTALAEMNRTAPAPAQTIPLAKGLLLGPSS